MVLAAGCASDYERLKAEADCDDHCRLRQSLEGFQHDTVVIPTLGASPKEVGVAVHEVCEPCRTMPEARHNGRTIVFIHGILSDHECWRFVAGELGTDHRMLLVDLPGCGDSDAPEAEAFPVDDLYEPSAMARRTLQGLRARLAAPGAAAAEGDLRLTIVAHSLGGAVTLRMFGEEAIRHEYADVLDRVDGLVLIAPLDAAMEKADPLFVKAARINQWDVLLGRATGIMKQTVARGIATSVDDGAPALREEADKRIAIVSDPARRRAMQAMMRSAVPTIPSATEFRPDWPRIDAITATYSRITLPCLIIWGGRDETLPQSMGYKLRAQLPWAQLRVLPTSKHSPHIERPREIASLIRGFLANGLQESALAR